MIDPNQIVAQGYDLIAERHSQWASRTRTRALDLPCLDIPIHNSLYLC